MNKKSAGVPPAKLPAGRTQSCAFAAVMATFAIRQVSTRPPSQSRWVLWVITPSSAWPMALFFGSTNSRRAARRKPAGIATPAGLRRAVSAHFTGFQTSRHIC